MSGYPEQPGCLQHRLGVAIQPLESGTRGVQIAGIERSQRRTQQGVCSGAGGAEQAVVQHQRWLAGGDDLQRLQGDAVERGDQCRGNLRWWQRLGLIEQKCPCRCRTTGRQRAENRIQCAGIVAAHAQHDRAIGAVHPQPHRRCAAELGLVERATAIIDIDAGGTANDPVGFRLDAKAWLGDVAQPDDQIVAAGGDIGAKLDHRIGCRDRIGHHRIPAGIAEYTGGHGVIDGDDAAEHVPGLADAVHRTGRRQQKAEALAGRVQIGVGDSDMAVCHRPVCRLKIESQRLRGGAAGQQQRSHASEPAGGSG